MRAHTFILTAVATAFAVGFVTVATVNFTRVSNTERRSEARLQSIRGGEVQPEMLKVVRKYVNPGRAHSAHVIFSSATQPRIDVSATVDFFNSVNPGDAILGYYFADGYFIPENYTGSNGLGKWVFLGFGILMGGLTLALAIATLRLDQRRASAGNP